MAQPGIITSDRIFDGKHGRGQWSVAASADQSGFGLVLEVSVKSVVGEKTRDALHPLGGKHIVIDDNGIILGIVKGDGLEI